jgi:hypothetical protein
LSSPAQNSQDGGDDGSGPVDYPEFLTRFLQGVEISEGKPDRCADAEDKDMAPTSPKVWPRNTYCESKGICVGVIFA